MIKDKKGADSSVRSPIHNFGNGQVEEESKGNFSPQHMSEPPIGREISQLPVIPNIVATEYNTTRKEENDVLDKQ